MLQTTFFSSLLGGIFALRRLSEENWREYHIMIIQLMCAAVRTRPKVEEPEDDQSAPFEDVQAVIDLIRARDGWHRELEREAQFKLNLNNADLRSVDFRQVYLVDASLAGANLSGADLSVANLADADLSGALLARSNLSRSNLSGTTLHEADVSGADFTESENLTQAQLDTTRADPDNPPKLDNVKDAVTGKRLCWRDRPLR